MAYYKDYQYSRSRITLREKIFRAWWMFRNRKWKDSRQKKRAYEHEAEKKGFRKY